MALDFLGTETMLVFLAAVVVFLNTVDGFLEVCDMRKAASAFSAMGSSVLECQEKKPY
jgi:hypothetical protein